MRTRRAYVDLTWNGAAVAGKMSGYQKDVTYTDPASGEADSILCQEQVTVLRRPQAGVDHLGDPGRWHPLPEKVRHGTHKNGLRLLHSLRLVQTVAVQGRLETVGVGGALDLLLQNVEATGQRGGILQTLVETVGGPSDVAVGAPMAAPG